MQKRPNATQKKAIMQHDAIQIVIIDKRMISIMVSSFCRSCINCYMQKPCNILWRWKII